MWKVYKQYKNFTRETWIGEKEAIRDIANDEESYESIGFFKLAHIGIELKNHVDAQFNYGVDYPYLIVLTWQSTLREFYYFDTILGTIEFLNKILSVQETTFKSKNS